MSVKKLFILLCLLLFPGIIFAQDISHGRLNFEEGDGTPSVYPYKMIVSNSTLTDNGDGTASLSTGGATYPSTGIVISNGSAWGASIPDNSTNWNTAYSWGNYATRNLTINNVTQDLSTDRTWTITNITGNAGTVTNGVYTTGADSVYLTPGTAITTYVPQAQYLNTTAPLTGGGNLSADRILSIPKATNTTDGYLNATDWTTFNGKQAALGYTPYYPGGTDVTVGDGGTGLSSWTQYLIPYADTTTSFSQIPIGTSGQVLTSNGAGSVASFQNNTASMVYPGAGIPISNGTAWSSSLTETDGNIIYGSGGNWTKGTAIPNNVTATTQSQADNSTKLSTTAYVDTGLTTKVTGDGTVNPTNLLSNGDFENWSAGASAAPDGWVLDGAGASVAREGTIIKLGTYSAKLTRAGTDCSLNQAIHATRGIAYWKSRKVTVSKLVYATVADRARLSIQDGVDTTNSSYHTGNSTWQLLTVTHTVNASATGVTVYGQVNTGDTSAYFDGAMLVEGESAFAFSDKPMVYGDTRNTMGYFTREMDAASGDVSYTGTGFTPTGVMFTAQGPLAGEFSIGGRGAAASGVIVDNSGITANIWSSSVHASLSAVINLIQTTNVQQYAILKTFDANGFTLTWTKVGSPTAGTATVIYYATR